MKNINMKKFIILVSTIVISFCLIAAIGLWVFLSPKTKNADTEKIIDNNGANVIQQDDTKIADTQNKNNQNGESTDDINGIINLKSVNALVEIQKYTLLSNGDYNKDKVNRFIEKNIEKFFPIGSTEVGYEMADLNKDGINEIALMYEISNDNNKYLMISTVRWENGKFTKDIDKVLKKNDYNFENNEIIYGDIITGGNSEFIFIQKDPTGIKTSRAKIFVILNKEFSDYYTIDSPCELEINDYDDDSMLEVYTSLVASDGIKHMSWKKWTGSGFIEYDKKIETILNEDNAISY